MKKSLFLILGIMLIGGCQAPANNSATDGMSEKWGNCLIRYSAGQALTTTDSKKTITDNAYKNCKKEMNEAVDMLVEDISADSATKAAARKKAFEMIEDGYRQEIVPELYNAIDEVRKL